MLWNGCVPPKVCFFAWEACKALTMEQLKKRGYQMPSKCPLCKKAEEDLDHLLIHCPAVWGMWAVLLSIPGFQWVCPYLLKEVLSGWSCFPIKKKNQKSVEGCTPFPPSMLLYFAQFFVFISIVFSIYGAHV